MLLNRAPVLGVKPRPRRESEQKALREDSQAFGSQLEAPATIGQILRSSDAQT
jgi:hypothetical protein